MKAKPKVRSWGATLMSLVVGLKAEGASYREVAAQFGISVGTVKTWCARARKAGGVKPGLKPAAAKGNAGEMQPGMKPCEAAECHDRGQPSEARQPTTGSPKGSEAKQLGVGGRGGMGAALCRGLTRWDLPGKGTFEQSVNFRNLRKGTYPPKCWKIPGYLEGEALKEAIWKANQSKGRKKDEG